MRTKKRRVELISFYDHTGLEKHFAKMAKKGWLIEGISNLYWTYRKIEPKDLHFCVTYYPKASDFDPEPTEGQKRLLEFCAHTGWELCCTWFQMQVFCNERENPIPLETDPVLEVETLHKACKKDFLPSHFVLTVISLLMSVYFGASLVRDPIGVLSRASRILTGIAYLAMLVVSAVELISYFSWHRKANALARDGIFSDTVSTTTVQKGIMAILMTVLVWWLGNLFVAEDSLLFWVAVLVLTYMIGFMLLINGIKWGLKKLKASRETNRALTLIACFVLSLVVTGVVAAVVVPAANSGAFAPEKQEPPLVLSDLTEFEQEGYREGSKFLQTPFLGQRTVYQRPGYAQEKEGAPKLVYSVTTVKLPFLYGLCKAQYLESRLERDIADFAVDYIPTEATLWGAEEAYRQLDESGNLKTSFLLFYERTIVLIHLNWEPTPEQMTTVRQKLGN